MSSSSTRRTRRAACVAAVLALAGCGDDGPARTTPAPTEQPGAIVIAAPDDGDRVRARDAGGRLLARTTVRGTADAGAEVIVNGGCDVEGCLVHVAADDRGRWKADVRLAAPADEPEVRVAAYYRGSIVGPEDRVELRLAAPRPDPDRGRGRDEAPAPGSDPSTDLARGGSGSGSDPSTEVGTLVLIGDSLAVGIEDLLPQLLPGWSITSDALTSRPLAAGMEILARTRVPDGAVVAISLFTNDDPSRTAALEAAVRTSVRRAGAGGCAIWATIARPPFGGRGYGAANALLRRLDAQLGRRLAIVPWAEQAAANGWLAEDRVHATPEGYRARAQMYAEAARAC